MAARNSLKKRLLSSPPVHWLGSLIFSLIMRSMFLSARVSYQFPDGMTSYQSGEKPAIFCFWHGRMIMHPFVKPPRPMLVLISHHNDGALITATMRWFGIGAVRTARKRGSTPAVRELLAVASRGDNIAITPDGPRGPLQQAAGGAAYVAMKTGYPIIPVTFSARRHWRLRSWDRFMIPKWFTRMQFIAGEPMMVDAQADEAQLAVITAALTAQLNHLTAQADAACGVPAL